MQKHCNPLNSLSSFWNFNIFVWSQSDHRRVYSLQIGLNIVWKPIKLNIQTLGSVGLPWIWLSSVMCQEILCDVFLNNDKESKLKLILFSWLTSWQHAYTFEVKDVGKTSVHWERNWIERLGREELTNTSERCFDSNGGIKGWIGL